MLRVVISPEGQHTLGGGGLIPIDAWTNPSGIWLKTDKAQTGSASIRVNADLSAGNGNQLGGTAVKAWWTMGLSVTSVAITANDYKSIIRLTSNAAGYHLGWNTEGFGDSPKTAKLALFSDGVGTEVTYDTDSRDDVASGSFDDFNALILEFDGDDNGKFTCWARINDGGTPTWALQFIYESGDAGVGPRFDPFSSSDGKNEGFSRLDDGLLWDDNGDNWNSRPSVFPPTGTTLDDFPRVSEAHMPATDDNASPNEYLDFDEIPPDDGGTFSDIDKDDYVCEYEAKKASVDQTIQAIVISHHYVGAAVYDQINIEDDGGTVQEDSHENNAEVKLGGASGTPNYYTRGGYYPWTYDEDNWTTAKFDAIRAGAKISLDETDTLMLQAIYFGSDFEWEPPVAAASAFIPRVMHF